MFTRYKTSYPKVKVWKCRLDKGNQKKMSKHRNNLIKASLFAIYLAAILYLTLLNREQEPERMAWLTLFGSYRRAWEESHEFILWGLIDNVIMMIPFGALLPWLSRRFRLVHTLAVSFVLTMVIESTQYLTRLGYFDVDDIWNNLWGTVIGYGMFRFALEITEAGREKRWPRWRTLIGGILPLVVFAVFFAAFLRLALGFGIDIISIQ